MNQPTPYFIRRSAPAAEKETIDLHDFSVITEPIHPLRDYWLTIKRHRWLILLCAIAILLCAELYTFIQTPMYTADATVLIERKAPQILKLQDTQSDAPNDYNQEFYKTQYEILKSRSLAERVVRDEGLQNHPLFSGDKDQNKREGLVAGLWDDAQQWAESFFPAKRKPSVPDAAASNTRVVNGYLSMLEVRPVAGTSLVQVRFTTPDPMLSAKLANAHASSYVRYGVDLRSQTNEDATEFLKERLTELKERVEQSEAALNNYRRDKGIISVDEKSNIVLDRLADLNKSLTVAEGERIALEAQVRTVRGRNYDELTGVLNNAVITSLKGDLSKLEAEYVALSKEFKPGYPAVENLKARIEDTRRRLRTEIQNDVKAIEAAYLTAKTKETELRAQMERQKKDTLNLKDSAVQYAVLAREVDTNRQLYDGVLQRLKEIGVAAENRSSNIYLMARAQPPLGASYPDKRRSLLIGLLLGLAGGVGLAFLLEQLDNTLKSAEEAERYVRLPTLAVMPDFRLVNGGSYGYVSRLVTSAKAELPSPSGRRSNRQLVLDHHPLSLVTEAYRVLRSSLMLSLAGGPPQVMLMTSAVSGEGKTTSSVNTAAVFAQLGIRVLIIDADLRRPHCHWLLEMENATGLSQVLTGQVKWPDGIRSTKAENLFLMSSGALPPNPAELLGSKKMYEMLEQLRQHYEFIIIDSSPVMAVSDAVFLSTMVDGTLLVVNRRTPKQLVKKTRLRLTTPHTKMLGILLNRIDIRTAEYGNYYNYFNDYYHHPSDAQS